jgi:hypothetical protein
MFLIKPLPEFTEWLDGLSDASVRGVVAARIKRLERGALAAPSVPRRLTSSAPRHWRRYWIE